MAPIGSKPPSSGPPSDRRKSPLSLGHLKRVKRGEAPLIPQGAPVESRLQRLQADVVDGVLPWPQACAAVLAHRDAFKADPYRALLPRPSPAFAVRVAGHEGVKTMRLYYDQAGRVEGRLGDALRGASPYELQPAGRRTTLTAADIQQIVALRKGIEAGALYSTAAAAMALCRAVRQARAAGDPTADFRQILPDLELPGALLLAHYKGGTCMTTAEVLRDAIEAKFGIQGVVASERIDNFLSKRPDPISDRMVTSHETLQHIQGDTHTDVVVPYYAEDGSQNFLKIKMGTGPAMHSDEAVMASDMEIVERDNALRSKRIMAQEVVIERPAKLAAEALVGPAKLNMKRWDTGAVFGINVLHRIAYLNSAATGHSAAGMSIPLHPSREPQDLHRILELVKSAFGLDDEAIKDLHFLCSNLEAYCEQVLVGPTAALQEAYIARQAAVVLREPYASLLQSNCLPSLPQYTRWAQHVRAGTTALERAAAHISAARGAAAVVQYQEAASELGQAAQLLAKNMAGVSDHDLSRAVNMLQGFPQGDTEAGRTVLRLRSEQNSRRPK